MAETMLAVVKADAKSGIEIREVPRPGYGRRDVLIKVKIASICGTDLHIYNWDHWAQQRIRPPLIPGHEFCGEVAERGDEVTSMQIGDFVSAEMHVPCGQCYQCRTGASHICRRVKILGVDADGAFAQYVAVPEANVWKLDADIPPEYATLLDPLGNAVHTVLSGDGVAAKTVAVSGCGPIGLFAIAVAKACGAARVFAVEVNGYRRCLAELMQADLILDPSSEEVGRIVARETAGNGVDVLLEMAGHADAIRLGLRLLRPGGRISLLGIPDEPVALNLAEDVIFKGATLLGISGRWMYQTWFQMQALLRAGKLNLQPVITDRLPLQEFSQGIERLRSGKAGKILLYP